MIKTRKYVRSVGRNTWRRRTTTGVVALIRVSGEARCGGAVARLPRTVRGASSQNMNARRTMRMTGIQMRNCRTS